MRLVQIAMLEEFPEDLRSRVPWIARAGSRPPTRAVAKGATKGAVVVTGVGKVSAAAAIARALAGRPGRHDVIAVGYCGSLRSDLAAGTAVVVERLVQHDFGATTTRGSWLGRPGERVLAFEGAGLEKVMFETDPALTRLLIRTCRETNIPWCRGTIATGDRFITSPADGHAVRASTTADVIDMESAAVAQVCAQLGARMAAVKVVSDVVGDHAEDQYKKAIESPGAAYERLAHALCADFLIVRSPPGGRPSTTGEKARGLPRGTSRAARSPARRGS